MFAGIAGRYDQANHLLSGGLDHGWRKALVRRASARSPRVVADLATGSGDVAFALKKALPAETQIHALDFCEPMLDEARRKQTKLPEWAATSSGLTFTTGDCLNLPLEDASIDVAAIAFGLRNLEDRHQGLLEMRRVLKPGGSLLVLEFSQPYGWFKPFYYAYLKTLLPIFAGRLTGKKDAYHYLAGSIESFPTRAQITGELEAAAFTQVTAQALTFGTVALHEARA